MVIVGLMSGGSVLLFQSDNVVSTSVGVLISEAGFEACSSGFSIGMCVNFVNRVP